MNKHLWIYLTESKEDGAAGDWKRKGEPAEIEKESREREEDL